MFYRIKTVNTCFGFYDHIYEIQDGHIGFVCTSKNHPIWIEMTSRTHSDNFWNSQVACHCAAINHWWPSWKWQTWLWLQTLRAQLTHKIVYTYSKYIAAVRDLFKKRIFSHRIISITKCLGWLLYLNSTWKLFASGSVGSLNFETLEKKNWIAKLCLIIVCHAYMGLMNSYFVLAKGEGEYKVFCRIQGVCMNQIDSINY